MIANRSIERTLPGKPVSAVSYPGDLCGVRGIELKLAQADLIAVQKAGSCSALPAFPPSMTVISRGRTSRSDAMKARTVSART